MKTMILFSRFTLICLLLVLGCGSNDQSKSTQTEQPARSLGVRFSDTMGRSTSALGTPPAMEAADAVMAGGQAQTQLASSSQVRPRMVIKTADLECEVADYDKTFAEIQRLTDRAGGYVVASTVQNQEAGARAGTVVLRIPTNKFEETLQALKALARKVETESIRGNDVTEEFYDLSARLDNKRKAEQRFQEILRSAKTSREIMEVEQALMNIREEIERLEGRKRYLADQTDLSTISIAMHEPHPLINAETQNLRARLKQALGQGLELGTERSVNALSGAIAFVIGAVPLIVAVLVLAWIGQKYYRRNRRGAVATDAKKPTP